MRKETKGLGVAVLLTTVIVLTALGGSAGSFIPAGEGEALAPLETTVLKVGKADAIILTTGSETMVIDTGEEDDGEELVEELDKKGIGQVDVLVITHFDKDHVGGADTLVECKKVGRVLLPDYEGEGTEYTDFLQALSDSGLKAERLDAPVLFTLGKGKVKVEPPSSYKTVPEETEPDNNFSLITTVEYGSRRLVFTGDIEKRRIREWLTEGEVHPCDFLKFPHHGVYNTMLEELLDVLQPSYSVICDSDKNPADLKTIELLAAAGVDARETRYGKITVVTDGIHMDIRQKRK